MYPLLLTFGRNKQHAYMYSLPVAAKVTVYNSPIDKADASGTWLCAERQWAAD